MDRLPLPAVISIIEFGVTSPHRQPSLLRVCSVRYLILSSVMRVPSRLTNQDFYLTAIPTLYHSPHITSKLDSFFLHSTADVPDNYQSLSPRELLQAGHSKLAALRYLRHLTIALPGIDLPPVADVRLSSHDRTMALVNAQSKLVDQQAGDAATYLKSLPPSLVLDLDTVQIGDLRYYSMAQTCGSMWSWGSQDSAVQLLLRSRPRAWCHHLSTIMPLTFPDHTAYTTPIGSKPINVYNHTRACAGEIFLSSGGTTYIFIHPNPDYITNGAAYPLAGIISQWIAIGIHDVWGENELGVDRVTREAWRKSTRESRVILCFAGSSLVAHDDPAKENEDEREQLRLVVEGIRSRLSQFHEQPYLRDIVIEGRIAAEMPDCPACGMGAAGI